jgi:catalase (peroxidase I)
MHNHHNSFLFAFVCWLYLTTGSLKFFVQIMASLKKTPAAGQVSYADLIAMAGAQAVAVTGGPKIRVPVGRVDAAAADPPNRMASEMSSAEVLKQNFADKGFSVREMVVLSGAHTIGKEWRVGGGGSGGGGRAV